MKTLTITLIFLFAFACTGKKNDRDVPFQKVIHEDSIALRIYVDKNGIILANENRVTLEVLDMKLDSLQKNNGIIYYSRDNIAAEPPQSAILVVELITEYGLPVTFFSDKNFKKQVKF